MAKQPQRQTCQLCVLDDFLSYRSEGPALWRFECSNPVHGAPHSWLTTGRGALDTAGLEGVAQNLGVYEQLMSCVHAGEPMVEYGIVEYRYAEAFPDTYAYLVDEYSHTAVAATAYSASAFLGGSLGWLSRRGSLTYAPCPATGRWRYNGTISAWGTAAADPSGPCRSWEDFAAEHGIESDWPRSLLA